MKKGSLVISLDFELVWGIFDHIELENKAAYFDTTLKVIPQILEVFEQNSIHATWATVGMLFNENWEEWHANVPLVLPMYENEKLDPYAYGKEYQSAGLDRFFFAPNLIREIKNCPGQEVGTHTYSHYYCLEKGQTIAHFESDIKQAITIAEKFDIQLNSLVFPRNQFNAAYLEVCANNGIDTVRTNPEVWYWDTLKTETIFSKIVRTGDAYFPMGKKSYPLEIVKSQNTVCQPASRFLRPQHKFSLLNNLRLNRIHNEIIQAAKNEEVYHLWWHPHNFGVDSTGAMQALKEIVKTFVYCQEVYGIESLTMKELRDKCL